MSIALARTQPDQTVALPPNLLWADEWWLPVNIVDSWSLTGALVREAWVKTAGRPITLKSYGQQVWVPRATLETLYAWAADPALTMTLTLRGVTYAVGWRTDPALQGEPVCAVPAPAGDAWLLAELHLITV